MASVSSTFRKAGRVCLPHAIMIAFSASILLPLIWLARVALTDKLTAYKLPPEWATLHIDNFVEIFVNYSFARYFLNSMIAAIGSTAIALPIATAMAYAFARHNTGGAILRLFVPASQMLPPVILVLPMYSVFSLDDASAEQLERLNHRASRNQYSVSRLDARRASMARSSSSNRRRVSTARPASRRSYLLLFL